MPPYHHPAYQAAFHEQNELLAAELNGNPQVEYMDIMMYGMDSCSVRVGMTTGNSDRVRMDEAVTYNCCARTLPGIV